MVSLFTIFVAFLTALIHLLLDHLGAALLLCPVKEPTLSSEQHTKSQWKETFSSYIVRSDLLSASHAMNASVGAFWDYSSNMFENGFAQIMEIPFLKYLNPTMIALAFEYFDFDAGLTAYVSESNRHFSRFISCLKEERKIKEGEARVAFDKSWG